MKRRHVAAAAVLLIVSYFCAAEAISQAQVARLLKRVQDYEQAVSDPAITELSKHTQPQVIDRIVLALARQGMAPLEYNLGTVFQKMGVAAVPELSRCLRGEVKSPGLIGGLGRLSDEQQLSFQSAAGSALARIGKPAIPVLTEAFNTGDPVTRRAVMDAFWRMADPETVPTLAVATGDTNEDVREGAVWALGRIEDARATDALRLVYESGAPEAKSLHFLVALKLGERGAGDAGALLMEAMKSDDISVRESAVGPLGDLHDRRAVDVLITTVRNTPKGDYRSGAVRQAVVALGKIGDPRAVPALVDVLKNDPLDWRCAEALGLIRDERAVKVIAAQVGGKSEEGRYLCSHYLLALERIGTPEARRVVDGALARGMVFDQIFNKRLAKRRTLDDICAEYPAYLGQGTAGWTLILLALERKGDVAMAADLVRSRQWELIIGVIEWARYHKATQKVKDALGTDELKKLMDNPDICMPKMPG